MAAQQAAAKTGLGQTTTPTPRDKSVVQKCIVPMSASDLRTGLTVADLKQSFLDTLFCTLGRVPSAATPRVIGTDEELMIARSVGRVLGLGTQTKAIKP